MDKQYNAGATERRWLDFYRKKRLFHVPARGAENPFVVVIPPPNVTGVLHIGHALNNTIQDVLVRWQRMSGGEALWVPGTDHAGIATQNVVERHLLARGLRREEVGREAFLGEVWRWKEARGGTIIEQLERLGASCDWDRERFTMDEGLSRAVTRAFVTLYRRGLIYRGNYIVNWCPRCETALSTEEAAHQSTDGHLYHIRYPAADGGPGVVVATTRPETMFGDVAVAVHPRDPRYRKLVGGRVRLPVLDRLIPVLAHPAVEKGFGTGAVKVTPHHDANDFRIARDLGLDGRTVIDPRGVMTGEAGPCAGLDRFAAREKLLALLDAAGLLVGREPHQHGVGHCYRCDTVVEPYLSRQWFVRMKPLAAPALAAAARNEPAFYPVRWGKVYRRWLENIDDWCISRQIWWGHRLPVYYCRACAAAGGEGVIVAERPPESCPACGGGPPDRDPDVLDTWFSSWLWPFSVFGWPGKTRDMAAFYPTSVLVTAPEIIFFWVARMIMAGLEFTGQLPFDAVHIHGTVRDETGRKMSKSLGNVIDPLEVIGEVGADALRYSLISFAGQGQDLFIGRRSFHLGRNFANKIWNASRLVLARAVESHDGELARLAPAGRRSPAQRWIISELEAMRRRLERQLRRQRLNEASRELYQFFWHTYCDWYLEMMKLDLAREPGARAPAATAVFVLERFLRLLHPLMPFISEEIWSRLRAEGLVADPAPALARAAWPRCARGHFQPALNRAMGLLQEAVSAVREIKSGFGVPRQRPVPAVLVVAPEDRPFFESGGHYLAALAGIDKLELADVHQRQRLEAARILSRGSVFVPLAGLFDPAREEARLSREREALRQELEKLAGRLADERFLSRAPARVVAAERERHDRLTAKLALVEENLAFL